MRFGVLGPLQVETHGGSADLRSPRLRSLLGYFLIRLGSPATSDQVLEALWGDADRMPDRNTVQVYVSRLRDFLRRMDDRCTIASSSAGYQLEGEVDVDADRFEDLAKKGRGALVEERPRDALDRLTSALELWRGPAYQDLRGRPVFDLEGQRLDTVRLSIEDAWAAAALAAGRHRETVDHLRELAAAEPLREERWFNLMLALAGDVVGAISVSGPSFRLAAEVEEFGEMCPKAATDLGASL